MIKILKLIFISFLLVAVSLLALIYFKLLPAYPFYPVLNGSIIGYPEMVILSVIIIGCQVILYSLQWWEHGINIFKIEGKYKIEVHEGILREDDLRKANRELNDKTKSLAGENYNLSVVIKNQEVITSKLIEEKKSLVSQALEEMSGRVRLDKKISSLEEQISMQKNIIEGYKKVANKGKSIIKKKK